MIRRKENWPSLLAAYLHARRSMPFAWGSNDCCTFASSAVEAMTGVDFSKRWAPYSDLRGAAALLRAAGGVAGVADAALGSRVAPISAQRGDVVLLLLEGRESLAICEGLRAFAPGLEKIEAVDLKEAVCAWRV